MDGYDRGQPLSFGALLSVFRKRKRLTQQQLAITMGVHRSSIIRWEQGDFLPESKTVVLELARQLHLTEQETRQLLEASLTALSPYWSVPLPRNPYFTGREEILETLHAQLGVDQTVALTQSSALHGLGGVGKTQLALEYAYRHGLEYRAVFWIGAETEEQIISSLLRIAEVLQLPEREDKEQQRMVVAVQRWLNMHGQWLLVWDNVEDLALLDHFVPSTRSGAMLITTRRQTLGTFARGLALLPMEQEEGMLFLLRRAKVLSPEATYKHLRLFAEQMLAQYQAAANLVMAMGGLPLALDQAGAYLETTQCGLPAYLDLFRTQRAALLQQRGEGARDHQASVSTTFVLAIAVTAQHHPAVWDLLQVCALLHPDAIPEEIFRQKGAHLGASLEVASRDALEWDRLIAITCGYSLLLRQPKEQEFSMHRLVQAILLDSMTEAEQEQWNRHIIAALDAIFPEVLPSTSSTARKQAERLLAHTLLCLQRSPGDAVSSQVASVAYKTAQYLRERGRYMEAKPLFLRAWHVYEQVLGAQCLEVATVLNYLGVLCLQQGQYAEAKPLLVRALHTHEQVLGPDHPEITRELNNLAILLACQGQYAEALSLHHRTLSIREQRLGREHPYVASTLLNLGELYCRLGRYAEAKPLVERSLHIHEQEPAHPWKALALNNLGEIYRELGQYADAQRLFVRAWLLWRQLLGPTHPEMARVLANLGRLASAQGNAPRAARFYQRALQMWENNKEQDPLDFTSLLTDLAALCWDQGQDTQAALLYQRAFSLREQHLGSDHPETAQTLHDLALFHQKLGKLDKALSLAEQALSIRSQALGDAHPKTVATRTLYDQLLLEQAPTVPLPETDPHFMCKKQERPTRHTMSIAVRGGTEQVVYTRTVKMREVTFTCIICGQTVTQLHYPSGRIKYCSEACKAVSTVQKQKTRVARQREKRQSIRETQLQTQQKENV